MVVVNSVSTVVSSAVEGKVIIVVANAVRVSCSVSVPVVEVTLVVGPTSDVVACWVTVFVTVGIARNEAQKGVALYSCRTETRAFTFLHLSSAIR